MNKLQRIEEMERQLAALKAEVAQEAKPKQWRPQAGGFYVDDSGFVAEAVSHLINSQDFGTERKTREAAKKAAAAMRTHNRLLAYVAEFAPDWEPDWSNEYQLKTEVVFDSHHGEWVIENSVDCSSPSVVYMPEHVAKELCDKLNSGEVVL